jgi:hypothetical protein
MGPSEWATGSGHDSPPKPDPEAALRAAKSAADNIMTQGFPNSPTAYQYIMPLDGVMFQLKALRRYVNCLVEELEDRIRATGGETLPTPGQT